MTQQTDRCLDTRIWLGCRIAAVAENAEDTPRLPPAGMLWLEEEQTNPRKSPNSAAWNTILAAHDGVEAHRCGTLIMHKGDLLSFIVERVVVLSLPPQRRRRCRREYTKDQLSTQRAKIPAYTAKVRALEEKSREIPLGVTQPIEIFQGTTKLFVASEGHERVVHFTLSAHPLSVADCAELRELERRVNDEDEDDGED